MKVGFGAFAVNCGTAASDRLRCTADSRSVKFCRVGLTRQRHNRHIFLWKKSTFRSVMFSTMVRMSRVALRSCMRQKSGSNLKKNHSINLRLQPKNGRLEFLLAPAFYLPGYPDINPELNCTPD